MDHIPPEAAQRLALVVAGGGARIRRAVAALPAGREPFAAAGGALAAARDALAAEVPRILEAVAARGWRWTVPGMDGYPATLGELSDPPLGLFVVGRVPSEAAVAVVGSRRATAYGLQVAEMLGRELGRAGVPVISGMARGVDGAAHRGCLEGGGRTVAVWGTGPDRVYPAEHRRLAEAIRERGALVTEFLPGTTPRRHHFPQRNRIIAGLARATVVVEAGARSGALVTARLALEEGREVFAVPGSILSGQSVGPNTLLGLGARPLLSPAGLLEELGVERRVDRAGPDDPLAGGLPPGEALGVDEIAARAGLGVDRVGALLVELEVEGVVERLGDGRYRRRG